MPLPPTTLLRGSLSVFPSFVHPNIKQVNSFEQLCKTPFAHGVNALCWPRILPGGFSEIVTRLGAANRGVTELADEHLEGLRSSPEASAACAFLLTDLARLREHGLEPELNCIDAYPRDTGHNEDATSDTGHNEDATHEEAAEAERHGHVLPTDVYSFHVDEAPIETDTWLCTYFGAPTEGLSNDQARRRVDVEAARAVLRARFHNSDARDFDEYLRRHSHHLHYEPLPGATPWSFGVGYLWRVAVAWPGCPVPPCIHRAPRELPGQQRLLLIS